MYRLRTANCAKLTLDVWATGGNSATTLIVKLLDTVVRVPSFEQDKLSLSCSFDAELLDSSPCLISARER
jgi:hypothetical protein